MPDLPEVSEPSATRRRGPRYLRFLLSGGAVGVLVGLVLTLASSAEVERPILLFLYLGVLLGVIGALLGGLVAVVLDGRRRP